MNNIDTILNQPLFTIIIPVYKAEERLKFCLDSIKNQTYSNWECICVDDGSPDRSGQIIDEYALNDSRFICVHQKNQGVSAARNVGLNRARGQWVTFVDSDDTVEHSMLMDISCVFSKNQDMQLILSGVFKDVYDGDILIRSIICYLRQNKIIKFNDLGTNICRLWCETDMESVCNKFFLTEIIDRYRLRFNENCVIYEDLQFVTDFLSTGKPNIMCLNKSWYHYHLNQDETSTGRRSKKNLVDDIEILIKKYLQFLAELPYISRTELLQMRSYIIDKVPTPIIAISSGTREDRWQVYDSFRKSLLISFTSEMFRPGFYTLWFVFCWVRIGAYRVADYILKRINNKINT